MKRMSLMVLMGMFFMVLNATAAAPTVDEVQGEITTKTAQIAMLQEQIANTREQVRKGEDAVQQLTGQIAYLRGLVKQLKEPAKEEVKAGAVPDKKADDKNGKPNK